MAKLFHYHESSDSVRVVAGKQIYFDSASAFATDNGKNVPPLPPSAIERLYEPSVRHAISDGYSVVAAGPMPWAFGDVAIANIENLIAAQVKRRAAVTSSVRPNNKILKAIP